MSRRASMSVIAIAADLACLALFVVLGRESHDITSGVTWYLTVLWPFLVGWFAAALAFRLYTSWPSRWVRVGLTWGAGIGIALVLRATITGRDTPIAFIIVAYAFIGFAIVVWRLAARGVSMTRRGTR